MKNCELQKYLKVESGNLDILAEIADSSTMNNELKRIGKRLGDLAGDVGYDQRGNIGDFQEELADRCLSMEDDELKNYIFDLVDGDYLRVILNNFIFAENEKEFLIEKLQKTKNQKEY